jgi:hypothetical protein
VRLDDVEVLMITWTICVRRKKERRLKEDGRERSSMDGEDYGHAPL